MLTLSEQKDANSIRLSYRHLLFTHIVMTVAQHDRRCCMLLRDLKQFPLSCVEATTNNQEGYSKPLLQDAEVWKTRSGIRDKEFSVEGGILSAPKYLMSAGP